MIRGLVAALAFGLAMPASAACFQEAAARYPVSPQVLWAIAKHESNLNPAAINRNSNGTMDIGLMQINSIWLPQLSAYGYTAERLLTDACANVMAGAWILSQQVRRYGNTWDAIGRYHSATPGRRHGYALAIHGILRKNGVL